jgi:hypothetical protein
MALSSHIVLLILFFRDINMPKTLSKYINVIEISSGICLNLYGFDYLNPARKIYWSGIIRIGNLTLGNSNVFLDEFSNVVI